MKIEDVTKLLVIIENDEELSKFEITNMMFKKDNTINFFFRGGGKSFKLNSKELDLSLFE